MDGTLTPAGIHDRAQRGFAHPELHFTRNVFAAWMTYYQCLDPAADVLGAGGSNPAARRERRRRRTR